MLLLTLWFAFWAQAAKIPRVRIDPNVYFNCETHRGTIPNGSTIQDAGYRLTRINGQLVKNMSMVAVRTLERGKVFVKVWGPGFDPTDGLVTSDLLVCQDPNPPAPPKPYYYPDTY